MSSLVCLEDSCCRDPLACCPLHPPSCCLPSDRPCCPDPDSVPMPPRWFDGSLRESPLRGRWAPAPRSSDTTQLQGSSPSGSDRLLNELYLSQGTLSSTRLVASSRSASCVGYQTRMESISAFAIGNRRVVARFPSQKLETVGYDKLLERVAKRTEKGATKLTVESII